MLLFDEFEEIFEGLTRARQARYAQDLRHALDTLHESVLFVIATIPEPRDLQQYPAILRRLGESFRLEPIDTLQMAMTYVEDYVRAGHERYFIAKGQQPDDSVVQSIDPLSPEIVSEEYQNLDTEVKRQSLNVLPGYFLPRMRKRFQETIEQANEA